MERLRAIIGFTTNELNEFIRQAEKVARKTDDNIERGIDRWSHKEFRKTGDGRVFRDEADYTKIVEKIRNSADRKYGRGAYHDVNGKEKKLKKRFLQKKLREAKAEAIEQYLEDHPNLQVKYQLLEKLEEVGHAVTFDKYSDEWRNTRVIIQA